VAKIKPAKGKKSKPSNWRAVPCLILIVTGIALIGLLFYGILRSG
jgi:hypothetical protein